MTTIPSPTTIYLVNSTDTRPTEMPKIIQFQEPHGLKVFRAIVFAFVVLASLLGNSMVIKAVFENSLHKPLTHYLVSNMAVAELVGTILVPFSYAYQEIFYWPYGELLCHMVEPMQITAVLVTTTTLAAIAVHRYKFFTSPVRRRRSFRSIILIMLGIWVMAIAITLPSFLFNTRVSPDGKKFWCLPLFPGDTLLVFPSSELRRYYMVRFCLNYVVPIVVMVVAYGSVSIKLRFHRSRAVRDVEMDTASADRTQDTCTSQQQGGPGSEEAVGASSPVSPHHPQSQEAVGSIRGRGSKRKREQRKRKAISGLETDLLKMIYVIILIFLVCYFPYQIFFLVEYFGVIHFTNFRYFDIIRVYVFMLTCFPSALHPVCYGTMSKFFARTFSRLVLCRGSRAETLRT